MSIISHIDGHVAALQINRPETKNALTLEMYRHMADALNAHAADDAVRVVVIHGQPEMFCAGNDLHDFLNSPPDLANSPVVDFLYALRDFPKPLIMAVNGVAVGIGVTMLLHADFVVAAEDTKFQLPFINLALCPEAGSSLLLTQRAGYLRAAELLMFGEFFNVTTAHELGIVSRVMPHIEVLRHAQHQARHLAEKSPAAMRATVVSPAPSDMAR